MDITCKICGAVFHSTNSHANHVRWKHQDNSKSNKNISKATTDHYLKISGEIVSIELPCKNPKCNNKFTILSRTKWKPNTKTKKFCSVSCSHSTRTYKKWSDADKLKQSHIIKTSEKYLKSMELNRDNFITRSTQEIRILEYLRFLDSKWTQGPCHYKGEILGRDAIHIENKICFEYDGIWHFQDINGQLKKKQYKDTLLNEWAIENDWTLIRISEDYWNKHNQDFSMLNEMLKVPKGVHKFYLQ